MKWAFGPAWESARLSPPTKTISSSINKVRDRPTTRSPPSSTASASPAPRATRPGGTSPCTTSSSQGTIVDSLAEDTDGNFIPAEAKMGFVDDNAEFRHKDVFAQRDTTQETPPRGRRGQVGTYNTSTSTATSAAWSTGDGLAMSTMDIISLRGGSPANLLDVCGSAIVDQVKAVFETIAAGPAVNAIHMNIFRGGMTCDIVAEALRRAGVST